MKRFNQGADTGVGSTAQVAGLPTGDPVGSADWPKDAFTPLADDTRPCALLVRDGDGARTTLAEQPTDAEASAGVRVDPAPRALIRPGRRDTRAAAPHPLIDATGTAYALPGATAETVKRLGYTTGDIGTADQAWIALLRTGPALTEEAAGQTPSGGGG